MAHDAPQATGPSKLVIRNIGLLLSGALEKPILDAAHEVFGDHMRSVLEREFPLPDLIARSKAATQMVKDGLVSFRQRGSRWLWQLRIWRCDRV